MLREARGVRFGPPAPEWLIKLGTSVMGTESELVLKSRWVYPGWLEHDGFQFRLPDWASAANDLVRQMRQR